LHIRESEKSRPSTMLHEHSATSTQFPTCPDGPCEKMWSVETLSFDSCGCAELRRLERLYNRHTRRTNGHLASRRQTKSTFYVYRKVHAFPVHHRRVVAPNVTATVEALQYVRTIRNQYHCALLSTITRTTCNSRFESVLNQFGAPTTPVIDSSQNLKPSAVRGREGVASPLPHSTGTGQTRVKRTVFPGSYYPIPSPSFVQWR
jgi:hypothetical protein